MPVQLRLEPARRQARIDRALAWTAHAASLLASIGLVLLIGYGGMAMRAFIP